VEPRFHLEKPVLIISDNVILRAGELRRISFSARSANTQQRGQGPQQALDRSPSTPSFAMIGTISNAPMASAHHKPNAAYKTRPPRRMADRYEQKSACLASAFIRLEQFQVFPATSQSKLLFPNLLGKLDAGDRYGRSLELLEPEHRQNPPLSMSTAVHSCC
jgi:hypothetical protein